MARKRRAPLPLHNIRVADFSWIIAGPYGTMWLAVMGADVVRIESGTHLDINRRIPPYADGVAGYNRSGLWNGLNFSKRSCTIDLRTPRGLELAKHIIKLSDVVVENFGYGQMAEFGLDYADLQRQYPDKILVSSSGLGRTGPERAYVGYNEEFFSYAGLASVTGPKGGPPGMVGGVWADHLTGTTLALAVLAALRHRQRTGEGQFLDLSMAEAVMAQLPEAVLDYSMNGRVRGFQANEDDVFTPHNCYRCAGDDQWIALAVADEAQWRGLCRALGQPRLARDPRFADAYRRRQHAAELDAIITVWTKEHEPREAMALLQKAGVPAGPSNSPRDLAHDPHLRARGFLVEPEHPEVGKRVYAGVPWKLSAVEPDLRPAPALGQHNEEVFCGLLGLPVEQMASLIGDGVLV